jgi:DNA uptake protein ComE-like DNA-binding protein
MARSKWCGLGVAGLTLLLGAGVGCRQQTQEEQDQQIRQQAQQATEQARKDAKIAAEQARIEAKKAGHQLKAVAEGVRDGLKDNGKAGARLDVNTASRTQLEGLPGITAGKARAIIDGRPYGSAHDLVKKGVLTEDQYERISDRVTAN